MLNPTILKRDMLLSRLAPSLTEMQLHAYVRFLTKPSFVLMLNIMIAVPFVISMLLMANTGIIAGMDNLAYLNLLVIPPFIPCFLTLSTARTKQILISFDFIFLILNLFAFLVVWIMGVSKGEYTLFFVVPVVAWTFHMLGDAWPHLPDRFRRTCALITVASCVTFTILLYFRFLSYAVPDTTLPVFFSEVPRVDFLSARLVTLLAFFISDLYCALRHPTEFVVLARPRLRTLSVTATVRMPRQKAPRQHDAIAAARRLLSRNATVVPDAAPSQQEIVPPKPAEINADSQPENVPPKLAEIISDSQQENAPAKAAEISVDSQLAPPPALAITVDNGLTDSSSPEAPSSPTAVPSQPGSPTSASMQDSPTAADSNVKLMNQLTVQASQIMLEAPVFKGDVVLSLLFPRLTEDQLRKFILMLCNPAWVLFQLLSIATPFTLSLIVLTGTTSLPDWICYLCCLAIPPVVACYLSFSKQRIYGLMTSFEGLFIEVNIIAFAVVWIMNTSKTEFNYFLIIPLFTFTFHTFCDAWPHLPPIFRRSCSVINSGMAFTLLLVLHLRQLNYAFPDKSVVIFWYASSPVDFLVARLLTIGCYFLSHVLVSILAPYHYLTLKVPRLRDIQVGRTVQSHSGASVFSAADTCVYPEDDFGSPRSEDLLLAASRTGSASTSRDEANGGDAVPASAVAELLGTSSRGPTPPPDNQDSTIALSSAEPPQLTVVSSLASPLPPITVTAQVTGPDLERGEAKSKAKAPA